MIPQEEGHQRAYRGLLRLYPADFRQRFSDDMVQLFSDQLRDARTRGAPVGPAVTWLKALGDVAVTAASERARRNRTVAHSLTTTPPMSSRLLGLVGILGGLVLIAVFLPIPTLGPELNTVRLILFLLGAMAIIIAVHRRQAPAAPLLATSVAVAAFVAHAALLATIVLSIGPSDLGFALELAMWLAAAAFGLVVLRLGVMTRWGALALVVGSLLAVTGIDRLGLIGSAADPTIFRPLSQVGIGLSGLGWILLGLDLVTRRARARS